MSRVLVRRLAALSLVLLLVFFVFRNEKILQIIWVRMSGGVPAAPDAGHAEVSEGKPGRFLVDFVGLQPSIEGGVATDLFVAPANGMPWQNMVKHTLTLRLAEQRTVDLLSYNTFINYDDGRLSWMRVYPIPEPPVGYREALSAAQRALTAIGVAEKFDWQNLLDAPPSEGSAPVRYERVNIQVKMNCNWEIGPPEREQRDRVACLPSIGITEAVSGARAVPGKTNGTSRAEQKPSRP